MKVKGSVQSKFEKCSHLTYNSSSHSVFLPILFFPYELFTLTLWITFCNKHFEYKPFSRLKEGKEEGRGVESSCNLAA